jgi:hypothetical protein
LGRPAASKNPVAKSGDVAESGDSCSTDLRFSAYRIQPGSLKFEHSLAEYFSEWGAPFTADYERLAMKVDYPWLATIEFYFDIAGAVDMRCGQGRFCASPGISIFQKIQAGDRYE